MSTATSAAGTSAYGNARRWELARIGNNLNQIARCANEHKLAAYAVEVSRTSRRPSWRCGTWPRPAGGRDAPQFLARGTGTAAAAAAAYPPRQTGRGGQGARGGRRPAWRSARGRGDRQRPPLQAPDSPYWACSWRSPRSSSAAAEGLGATIPSVEPEPQRGHGHWEAGWRRWRIDAESTRVQPNMESSLSALRS